MAATASICDQIFSLLGKRSDDPAVLAFHKANGLKAPPRVSRLDLLYDVNHKTLHFAVNYQGEVKVPGLYPPRKEEGRWVAYLASATVEPDFEDAIVEGLTTKLTVRDAAALSKKLKKGSWKTGMYHGHVVFRRDGKEVCFVYDPDEKFALAEVRIQLEELDEKDPRLAAAAKEAKAKANASSPKREIPKARGKAKNEPLPKALADLAKLREGLGEIDLEMLEQIEVGGPKAWTNNEDAEHELRVFAQDGSGGLVAFWLVHWNGNTRKPLEEQPIVFLGSEGKVGPVAGDLADFFALLAAGLGPYEIVEDGSSEAEAPQPAIAKLAKKHFPDHKTRKVDAILDEASRDYGDIEARIDALNAH